MAPHRDCSRGFFLTEQNRKIVALAITASICYMGGHLASRRLRKLICIHSDVTESKPHCLHTQRHHKEDVIVGSLIGAVSATICYLIYWPNPFSPQPHGPRVVYDSTLSESNRAPPVDRYGYELTGMGNEHAEQSV